MKLEAIKQTCTRAAGASKLFLKKRSPEILTGTGIVGVVGTVILASKATLSVGEIIDDLNTDIANINKVTETYPEKYSERDILVAKTTKYVQTTGKIAKLYAPALSLGLASIGCILAAHGIMKKRNAALAVAFKSTEEAFNRYRDRVKAELGEEQESDIFNDIREEEVVDENGKKKIVRVQGTGGRSIYARLWDETHQTWNKDRHYNKMFLLAVQNNANDRLKATGHLFLNEVYDLLGLERTPEGQLAGWRMGQGDEYVDFGLDSFESPEALAFLDGTEPAIWLDFNVDGNILGTI